MLGLRGCQSGQQHAVVPSTAALTHGSSAFRSSVWHRKTLTVSRRTPRSLTRASSAAKWLAELRDGTVKVLFNMQYHCGFGQHLALVGNKDPLGGWNVEKSVQMRWSEGDVWVGEVVLDGTIEDALEYKYVVRQSDGTVLYWGPGDNIRLEIASEKASEVQEVVVGDAWDGTSQSVKLVSPGEEVAVTDGAAGGSWEQTPADQTTEDMIRTGSLPFSDGDDAEAEALTVEMMEAQARALEAEEREAEAELKEVGGKGQHSGVTAAAEARIRAEATQAMMEMEHLSVDEKAQQINQKVDELSSQLSECLSGAETNEDIEQCLIATDLPAERTEEAPDVKSFSTQKQDKYADLSLVLEGMYDSDVASYIVETVTEKALNDLDAALQRSQELQAKGGDPTAPELLAADRLVAAAAKRAVDMSRALDATKAAGMITAGISKERDEQKKNEEASA